MNERSHLDDRLSRHLDEAASCTRLRNATEGDIVRTAQRRTVRRRQATAVASLAAVGGVTAFGLRALTTTDSSRVTTDPSSETIEASDPATADQPAAAPSMATMTEPALVWRTVRPDSAAAVTTRIGHLNNDVTFPGVFVSTAPGRSGDTIDLQVWRSDDGISFDQVSNLPTDRSLLFASTHGERIYTFGTAPGVAATDPNPLLASFSADGGTTWNETTLPVDTHALRNAPGVIDAHTHLERVSIQGDAVLALVRNSVQLDIPGVDMQTMEGDGTVVQNYTDEGVVTVESDCSSSAVPTPAVASRLVDATSTTALSAADIEVGSTTPPLEDCPTTLQRWEDLGIDPAVGRIAAFGESRLLYSPDGVTFSDITDTVGPVDGFLTLPSATQHLVLVMDSYDDRPDGDGVERLLRTTDGATWEELPPPPFGLGNLAEVAGTLVAVQENYTPTENLEIATFDGTTWHPMTLGGTDGALNGIMAMCSGEGGLTLVAMSQAEGLTTDATLPTVTTTSISDTDGTVPPDTGPAGAGSDVAQPEAYVFHTFDGTNWSVQKLNEIVDIDDLDADQVAGTFPNVHRVATIGNQTQITLTYDDGDAETIPEALVLVGTPR